LWSDVFGWELRLDVNGSLVRSQMLRDGSQIDTIAAEWRGLMVEDGWQ